MSVNSKRRGDAELPPEPALDLVADPDEAAVGDCVLEPGVLAVRAVAEVALNGDDLLRDVDHLLRAAEPEDVGQAGVGLDLVVGHPHAPADRDVEARQPAVVVRDRDEAEVVGEDVDVVARAGPRKPS